MKLLIFYFCLTNFLGSFFLNAQLKHYSLRDPEVAIHWGPVAALKKYAACSLVHSEKFNDELTEVPWDMFPYIFEGFKIVDRHRQGASSELKEKFLFFMKYVLSSLKLQSIGEADKEQERVEWILKFKGSNIYCVSEGSFDQFLYDINDCKIVSSCVKKFSEQCYSMRKIYCDRKENSSTEIKKIILSLNTCLLFNTEMLEIDTELLGRGKEEAVQGGLQSIWDCLITAPQRDFYDNFIDFQEVVLDGLHERDPKATALFINKFYRDIFLITLEAAYHGKCQDKIKKWLSLFNKIIEYNHNCNNHYISSFLQLLNKKGISIRTLYLINYIVEAMEKNYSEKQIQLIAGNASRRTAAIQKCQLFPTSRMIKKACRDDHFLLEELQKKLPFLRDESLIKEEIIKVLKRKCGYSSADNGLEEVI